MCYINGTLELRRPQYIWPQSAVDEFHHNEKGIYKRAHHLGREHHQHDPDDVDRECLMIVGLLVMTRKRDMIPGRAQNAIEALYDGLQGSALSLGGPGRSPTSRCS